MQSKLALWATTTAPSNSRRSSGSTLSNVGLPRTSSALMPVMRVTKGGIGTPGCGQPLEAVLHDAVLDADRGDLEDAVVDGAAAGRLEVDDDKGRVGERGGGMEFRSRQ